MDSRTQIGPIYGSCWVLGPTIQIGPIFWFLGPTWGSPEYNPGIPLICISVYRVNLGYIGQTGGIPGLDPGRPPNGTKTQKIGPICIVGPRTQQDPKNRAYLNK